MAQSSPRTRFFTSFQEAMRRNDFTQLDLSTTKFPNYGSILSRVVDFYGIRCFPALHYTVACGDVKTTQFFLDHQFNVECQDKEGNTPLMWAVCKLHLPIVSLLVEKYGANVNAQNFEGNSPLSLASSSLLSCEIVSFLLKHGANPNTRNVRGETPLHVACACNVLPAAQRLVEYGAWIEAVDEEGDTPLHFAVREGNSELVEWLLSVGADKEHMNDDEESPLMLATMLGDDKILSAFQNVQKDRLEQEQDGADVGLADARDVKISLSCEVKQILNTSSSMDLGNVLASEWKETEPSLNLLKQQYVN
jgi:ankyrin repeat protein